MKGQLFNVQRFSVHDGPGIRTTMFFKGCNLRCQWCHNPESWLRQPQMQYFKEKCIACGECMRVCEHGIRIEDGVRIGQENCILCRKCESVCLGGALKYAGEEHSVEDLVDVALKDRAYYDNSGGGVTVSGGEPLLQADFAGELLCKLKQFGISTALDTAGNVDFQCFEAVLPYTDLVLLDMKIMDSTMHETFTGVSNDRILENAEQLLKREQRMHIRVPVIAGINDSIENAMALKKFIGDSSCVEEVRFLPYHDMGLTKAASVGINMKQFKAPDEQRMTELRNIFGEKGK